MNDTLKQELKKHCEREFVEHKDNAEMCGSKECEFKNYVNSCCLQYLVDESFYPKDIKIQNSNKHLIEAFLRDHWQEVDERLVEWIEWLTNSLNDTQTINYLVSMKKDCRDELNEFRFRAYDLFKGSVE